MKILIYGLNYSPELTGVGKYTGEMVTWLAEHGHQCRVITSPPYYPAWEVFKDYSAWKYKKEQSDNVIVYRCPLWVPSCPKTISRILHLLSFNLSSFPLLCGLLFWQADVVICIAPSFLAAPQGLLFSKLSNAKSWLHFQDFEICSMFGSGLASDRNGFSNIAHSCQKIITRKFDTVSTISQAMRSSAMAKKVSKKNIVLFPNWVDTDFITPDIDRTIFRKKWKIDEKLKVILYSGNIGKKQGLESLVGAGVSLREREDILFVVVGDGAHKMAIQDMVQKQELTNILFYPLQPYEQLPALLRMADIHLVPQKRDTADTVFPSKLATIFAVGGHAIITAKPDTELGHIVSSTPGIATIIEPEDIQTLTLTIANLCNHHEISNGQINTHARKYAVERLDKEAILRQFELNLNLLINNK